MNSRVLRSWQRHNQWREIRGDGGVPLGVWAVLGFVAGLALGLLLNP